MPGYISRSVAGSFDNEGIAIFALILTYFFWCRVSLQLCLCACYSHDMLRDEPRIYIL